MVIQRWQTLLLLLAAIILVVFCLTPIATATDTAGVMAEISVRETPVFLTINALIAVLLLISVFTYKNLNRQIKITLMSIGLLCVSIITGMLTLFIGMPQAQPVYFGGISLLFVSLILSIAAYRCMIKDRNLLRSYDRLR